MYPLFFYFYRMKGFTKNLEYNSLTYPQTEDILKLKTDIEIFNLYIPNLKLGRPISSPFGTDKIPSFSVYWSSRYNKYLFKEHRYGWFGDCFDFVKLFFNLNSIRESCMKICVDMEIDGFHIDKSISKSHSSTSGKKISITKGIKSKATIKVTFRNWEKKDIDFWNRFGITPKWLDIAKIYPIKYFYIRGYMKIADSLSYVYLETKDNIESYKIYQPFNKKEFKWISNNDSSVWELWRVLPKQHDFLIITKSRKDALSIMSTINIPATSLQAEGTLPKESVVNEVKNRFKHIFLLYDNDFEKIDNYGRMYGKKLSEMFDIPQIEIPTVCGEKDYSDLVFRYGVKEAKKILWFIIKQKIIKMKLNDN